MICCARGGFLQPCNLHYLLTPTISFSLFLVPRKIHQTNVTNFSITSSFNPFLKNRTGFCAFALKKRRNGKNSSVLEMEGSEDDFEYDDNEDEDEIENEEDDGEGIVIPLENMKKWLENKPLGFGEGKAYDTSVEDKLFEEIEQSKEAQLANVNKLKNNPIQPDSKKNLQKRQKAPEVIPSGICVRLSNLPKKKNIHKNLQLAFKGVPGILKIVPAVSGNEKTRDPVCKGFGFVYLRSEEDANRLVQMFSRQSIAFGKIQKQIKCEIIKPHTASSDHEESGGNMRAKAIKRLAVIEKISPAADFNTSNSSSIMSEETVFKDSDVLKNELITAEWEDTRSNPDSLSRSELNSGDSMEPKTEPAIKISSSTPTQQKKSQPVEKKLVDKRKGGKVPKLSIPGSANRLKMKEKAVLSGVLSKYAEIAASASRKD